MSQPAAATLLQRLRGMTRGDGLRAQLVRGGLGSGAVMALNRLLLLALGIVLARALGAEGYGIYAYAFAIMSLLMVAGEAGVPTLLMREVAASSGRQEWGLLRGALIRAGQFVALTGSGVSLLGLLVLWMMADRLTPAEFYTALFMLLILPLSALAKTVAHAMRGLHRVVAGQAVDMLLRPALALAVLAVVFTAFPDWRTPQTAMAVQLGAVFVVLLVGVLVLRRFLPAETRAHPAEYRSKEWLKSALPFTLIGGAVVINNKTDLLMLGWFRTSAEVGIYAVAAQGGALIALILAAASAVVAPHFSRMYFAGQRDQLAKLFSKIRFLVFLATLPVALSFIFFGDVIAGFIFGLEYFKSYAPLAILAIGYVLNISFGPIGLLCQMTGYERETAKVMWHSVALNIPLNLVFIPLYGTTGAAASTATCLVFYHWRLTFICKKEQILAY